MDSWFHIRGLLKDRAAYNHVSSIWANLRSRKWELDISKRQYHYFSLHTFTYCHLDGTPFHNISGVLYGENITDIPLKCTQVLSQPKSNFLSSEDLIESINGPPVPIFKDFQFPDICSEVCSEPTYRLYP